MTLSKLKSPPTLQNFASKKRTIVVQPPDARLNHLWRWRLEYGLNMSCGDRDRFGLSQCHVCGPATRICADLYCCFRGARKVSNSMEATMEGMVVQLHILIATDPNEWKDGFR